MSIMDAARAAAARPTYKELKAEVERMRIMLHGYRNEAEAFRLENARLRAALQKIIDEADSDDGLTAWDRHCPRRPR